MKTGLERWKMMTILYPLYGNLYVNMTNRCPCACTFCLRNNGDELNGSGNLWLEREPSVEEVKKEFDRFLPESYQDVVFCGYGEPTERLEDVLEVAQFVKENFDKKIRINTNGLAELIHKKEVAPMFAGKIDEVSISLNTPDPEEYLKLTRSRFGQESFGAMLKFAEDVKAYVPKVTMTTVATTISKEEEEQCRRICERIGVTYRIRTFEGA